MRRRRNAAGIAVALTGTTAPGHMPAVAAVAEAAAAAAPAAVPEAAACVSAAAAA